jgi:phosphate-selective porin OprO/OprP
MALEKLNYALAFSASLLLASAATGVAQAQESPVATARPDPPRDPLQERLAALEAQVEALSAQIVDLKTQSAANVQDVRDTVAAQPAVTLPNGKPSFATADGRFTANIRAIVHFDAANYFQKTPGPIAVDLRRGAAAGDTAHARDLNSGTNFRRARVGFDGKVFSDIDYNFVYEFGGSGQEDAGRIYEASIQYNRLAPFRVKLGSFIPNQGLEDSGSTNGGMFLERTAPSDITRTLAGGDSRTALQLFGYGDRWLTSFAITGTNPGTINSTGSTVAQPFDEQLGYIGRLAYTPFKGQDWRIHVGANASYVAKVADTLGPDATNVPVAGRYTIQFRERPELRVDGTRLIDTGAIEADHAYTAGLEAAVQYKNFFAQAEGWRFGVDRRNSVLPNPRFSAWYVEGGWILTGEARRYEVASATFNSPNVAKPFNGKDQFGAWELALRYSDVDLNYHEGSAGSAPGADAIRGGEQKIFTAGLNWYWNSTVRFMLDLQDVKIERLSPNATTFSTPAGAQIGQHYQAVALRSQFAF